MADVWKQIGAELSQLLDGTSFRKYGKAFVDTSAPGVRKEIEIEKFRWNTKGQRRFVLTMRIYLGDKEMADPDGSDWGAHFSLVFQKNAGYLWDDEAHLFVAPAVWPCESFTGELRRRVSDSILPFFERCKSVDALIAVLEQENHRLGINFFSLTLAIALARLGRLEESRKHFRQSLGDAAIIRQFAERHGVRLDP